jgi:hypothetical protein
MAESASLRRAVTVDLASTLIPVTFSAIVTMAASKDAEKLAPPLPPPLAVAFMELSKVFERVPSAVAAAARALPPTAPWYPALRRFISTSNATEMAARTPRSSRRDELAADATTFVTSDVEVSRPEEDATMP